MHFEIEKLEFKKILSIVRSHAVTDDGKDAVMQLRPMNVEDNVKKDLNETETAMIAIKRYDETPLWGVLRINHLLKRAEVGSALSEEELLRFVSHEEALNRSLRFNKKLIELDIDIQAIHHYYEDLIEHDDIKRKIKSCINEKADMMDTASETLNKLRKKIRVNEHKIRERMDHYLHSYKQKLSDSIITIRDNRLVLPVKSEHKNHIDGILHDESSSGETVYIEPAECVRINNDIQALKTKEHTEIERILGVLTSEVGKKAEEYRHNQSIFITLDVVFAKAKLALDMKATRASVSDKKVELLEARHPLIPDDEVVPNSISFGTYRVIIITGPNTGGKTVALKTLGLLALMHQTGFLIPVREGSKLPVFRHIFADIGDEQSIEQSLSTFSSHINKIIGIFKHLEDKSLVLLDELGSGTDPKEGASLAISMLNYLRRQDIYGVVTTHYPELKLYAYELDDTVNASVEFDIDTLKPTYKLRIGIPGTSNALDIAERLGMDSSIINDARDVSLSFDTDTAKIIKKLEKQSELLQEKINAYEQKIVSVDEEKENMRYQQIALKKERNKERAKIEKEKQKVLEDAKAEAKHLIDALNSLKDRSFKEHELADLKHETKHLSQKKPSYEKTDHRSIEVGDDVLIVPYQRTGTILKKRGKKEYEVQMGALTSTFSEDQLELSDNQAPQKKKPPNESEDDVVNRDVKKELDLRGMRYQEAMDALDKFVDDCLMNNLEQASIIHGYGTGALRKGVREYIRRSKQIKKSRHGGMNEGGKGITIVYFK